MSRPRGNGELLQLKSRALLTLPLAGSLTQASFMNPKPRVLPSSKPKEYLPNRAAEWTKENNYRDFPGSPMQGVRV